jgi:hypothetical protein
MSRLIYVSIGQRKAGGDLCRAASGEDYGAGGSQTVNLDTHGLTSE